MLYYGDRARELSLRPAVAAVAAALERARGMAAPVAEDALVGALVDAGELAQGLADRAFAADGHDGPEPTAGAALALTVAIARWLWSSWSTSPPPPADGAAEAASRALRALASSTLPASVTVNVPEGYAHYALHPAAYGEAGRALAGAARPIVVIGIRSIGTGLAAMVAAASGAEDVLTVRPAGHPFRRRVAAGSGLQRHVAALARAGATFAVADEGPGLSGSSFDAVVEWLVGAGADSRRIVLFPSHTGALGPAATADRRARWDRAAKHVVPFEEVLLPRLRDDAQRIAGPCALHDLGGGLWRAWVGATGAPAFAQQERRKYLAVPTGPGAVPPDDGARLAIRSPPAGAVLLRFAGFGAHGGETLRRATALAEAGFAPAPATLARGFLAQRWIAAAPREGGGARAARASPSPERVARYVAFRARAFPAGAADGAAPERLLELVRVNAAEALGAGVGAAVERFEAGARDAERLARVAVDGKMERWEWLAPAGARAGDAVLKADATDHAFGHDLVGCQPAAWDVAGAHVELGLRWDEAVALARRVSPGATPAALAFLEAAYLAHRVGRWWYALQVERDPAERARIERALARYTTSLRRRLEGAPGQRA